MICQIGPYAKKNPEDEIRVATKDKLPSYMQYEMDYKEKDYS